MTNNQSPEVRHSIAASNGTQLLDSEWAPTDLIAASFDFILASAIAVIDPARKAERDKLAAQPLDPHALLRLARWHRIMPLVERAVADCGIQLPPTVAAALATEANRARLATFANAGDEARLARAAKLADIDVLFLKGATLSHLIYADPSLKSSWDIDMLIDPTDAQRACALLHDAGFVMEDPLGLGHGRQRDRWIAVTRETIWHHPQRGTTVELHLGLTDTPALLRTVGMSSPRQCAMIGGIAVPTLAADQLFAYLCVHGSCHGWARLKWLIDAAILLRNSSHTVAEWRTIAAANGAGRCGDVTLLLSHKLFGMAMPAALIAEMERNTATRSVVDYSLGLIDRVGAPGKQLSASTLPEIWAHMINLLRCCTGPLAVLQTAWTLLNRPTGVRLLWAPKAIRSLAMLGWLPFQIARRAFAGPAK